MLQCKIATGQEAPAGAGRGVLWSEKFGKIFRLSFRPLGSTVDRSECPGEWCGTKFYGSYRKARNNNLVVIILQISRESIIDKNGAVSQSILTVRQYQISRESIIDKNGAVSMILVGDKIESVTREVGLLDAPGVTETEERC
ncbi:hypothetical protein L2E82_25307 [Cichorium intybus]|uniref:Uncharacterized protein n=1 Tax=Cichorium intybus TaxID=13427 RepID=A0ACB9E3I6_CICIN|nr:hypothetical protein L2E82_25307 [Cichorium intybus]